jgi:hypothetical protein
MLGDVKKVLDAGYWILDTRYWMNFRYSILDILFYSFIFLLLFLFLFFGWLGRSISSNWYFCKYI